MDYYRSSYYREDGHGDYTSYYPLTHYSNGYYDSSPVQDSNNYQNFTYDSVPFFDDYNSVSTYPRIAYSVSNFCEPKHISYDPSSYYQAQTQFIISYSVSEFNEPEFEEYDPTPYGGGYDLALTYGKPLLPSDEICYPRSSGTITVPSGEDEVEKQTEKPTIESKPTAPMAETEQQLQPREKESLESYPDEDIKGNYVAENHPWPGYGNESREVSQIPSGYGLEAMDLCEGIFGYWPCLSRYGKKWGDCQQQVTNCGNCNNQWNEAADYLFGSSYPYGERKDDGNGIYGYQIQRQHQQVEDSWYS